MLRILIFLLIICIDVHTSQAQQKESPIQVFGYFQTAYRYLGYDAHPDEATFMGQQLNLFFQKDLAKNFRGFVNFEFTNTFSSAENWGSASMKEAWVRYDISAPLKVKVGLQLPVFNHLNEIRNRTPILRYIIRPIVYENSLQEIVNINDFVPEQSFLQFYGNLPVTDNVSLDYAAFMGNSPNVSRLTDSRESGVDTTSTKLYGGRLGLHAYDLLGVIPEFKAGISSTFDRMNSFRELAPLLAGSPEEVPAIQEELTEIPRIRFGIDLLLFAGRFFLEAEAIGVTHERISRYADIDQAFAFITIGASLTEELDVYASGWTLEQQAVLDIDQRITGFVPIDPTDKVVMEVFTWGGKYSLNDRVTLKTQLGRVKQDVRELGVTEGIGENQFSDFWLFSLAVSVFF